MQALAALYGIFIGIGLISGVGHLFLWFRRRPRDPVYLSFGIMTLLISGIIIFDMGYRFATTVDIARLLLNWGIALTALALVALIWFVSYYTDVQPRRFLWIMTGLYLVAAAASITTQSGILYDGEVELTRSTLPWGEPFTQVSGTPSIWQVYNIAIFILTFGFIIRTILVQYRTRERRQALMLLAGIGVVIIGAVYDFLLDFGIISHSIGLYPLSYIGLTIVMSLALAENVVRSDEVRSALVENERRWRTLLEGIEQIVVGLDTNGRVNYVNPYFTQTTGYEATEAMGKDWMSNFIPVQERNLVRHAFSDILQAEIHRNYTNSLLTRSGDERTIIWSNVRLYGFDNSVVGTLSVGRDVTEQLAAETALARQHRELEHLVAERTSELEAANAELERQHQSTDRRRSTAEGFTSIVAALNTDRPLDEILADLTIHANQLLESSGSMILRLGSDDGQVMTSTVESTQVAWPMSAFHTLLTNGAHSSEPVSYTWSEISAVAADRSYDPTDGIECFESVVIIPLTSQQLLGWGMILFYRNQQDIDQEVLDNATILQGQVVLALENAQLREYFTERAAAAERNRLSRELHDSVTQNLYTISSMAEVLPELVQSHPGEVPQAMDNLRLLASGALAEMRTLLLELRPSVLRNKDLGELLKQLADGLQSRTHTQLTVTIVNDRIFPQEVQIALYRIAQEALNNVLKHSAASVAVLGLYCENEQATMRIHDNGVGFDQNSPVDGLGLHNMRERADQIHATFVLESTPDSGTEITVVWRERS